MLRGGFHRYISSSASFFQVAQEEEGKTFEKKSRQFCLSFVRGARGDKTIMTTLVLILMFLLLAACLYISILRQENKERVASSRAYIEFMKGERMLGSLAILSQESPNGKIL